MIFCLFLEEESGSEEETPPYYTPAELGFRNMKKRKNKMQSKNSQSLFSVLLSVNHCLIALHTEAKVQTDELILIRNAFLGASLLDKPTF